MSPPPPADLEPQGLGALTRLEIDGFKSIEKANLDLGMLNVLIGANGAGKSNLLEALHLLNRIGEQRLADHVAGAGGASRLLHFGPKRTPTLRIRAEFEQGTNWYQCGLAWNDHDEFYFSDEECGYSGGKGYRAHSGRNPTTIPLHGLAESGLKREIDSFPEGSIAGNVRAWLRRLIRYHFHDTTREAAMKRTGPLRENEALKPDAGNLAAFLHALHSKSPTTQRAYQSIVRAVTQVAPCFEDFVFVPEGPPEDPTLRLRWRHRGSDDEFYAASLSDGTLRFMALATLLLQPRLPPIVLIDEPELGLHPAAIALLVELLRSATHRGTQIIVSTQSTTLVNQLTPEEVTVVDNQNGSTTFQRHTRENLSAWLGDYGLGDLWEKNLLGGRP